MIRVESLHLNYVLSGKKFTRTNMILRTDYLNIARAIRESEDDIAHGRIYNGIEALKELRRKYGYR